jgi:hypothetical protein
VWVHPACAKNLEGVREMLAPPEHLRFRRVESYDLGQHEEDLTLLLHAWPDIEEALLRQADDEGASNYRRDQAGALAAALRRAFRVEVQLVEGMLLERELGYVVLFDVNDYDARQRAATLREQRSTLDSLVYKHAQTQGSRPVVGVQIVPSGKPIGGEVCPRVMVTPKSTADLRDLPEPEPPATSVPLVTRGLHKLTPIEAPIYDVLQETDLVFAVQPRVQGDRTYRPDFIVFYGGRGVVVELDGHRSTSRASNARTTTSGSSGSRRRASPLSASPEADSRPQTGARQPGSPNGADERQRSAA